MPHKAEKLILDVRIACEEIRQFCAGQSFDDFLEDRMLQLALEREFEIIGEAFCRLERIDLERLAIRIPGYRKIIGFRNLVAHGYDIIDDVALWDLVQMHVPDLLEKTRKY